MESDPRSIVNVDVLRTDVGNPFRLRSNVTVAVSTLTLLRTGVGIPFIYS
jgi:hypothetical protein